jgi:tetratricopeptide (TPR) repeat protein
MRLRQLAERIDPTSEPVLGFLTLTRALRVAGEEALAERLLSAALTARPGEVVLYHTLGQLLQEQEPPRWSEAAECYRVARGLRPDLGVTLAEALLRSGREQKGLDLLAWLVKENPDNPYLHFQQGNALAVTHDRDSAIASFKKSLELDPKHAQAHYNLGVTLMDKGDLDSALSCYKKALDLDPKLAQAHTNLGNALHDKSDRDVALSCYKKALELDPRFVQAHNNLGVALHDKGDLDGAIASHRQALELDPKDVRTYTGLGAILCDDKHDLDGALACFRKALELDPKLTQGHYNLGNALMGKGHLDEAMAEYRQAIRLKPDYAEAHCNLGHILRRQGHFGEALTCLRRGHELGSKQPGWRYPSAQWVRDTEQEFALERKLPAILSGEETPANPDETVALAWMCQQHKRRHVAAARLYADAFAAEPKLAAEHRYNAACSAALAAGQGEDARLLPDKVVTMFRRWALDWLRADLTAYAKLAEQNNPAVKQVIQQRLAPWRQDPDLASVREPQALDHLPDNERASWQALWRDVDELAKKVEPTQGRKEPQAPEGRSAPPAGKSGR